jgi:bifunctional DNA-binding transcriptional regulator/antitoxin component of YhaV-PrlF toxin-antitoxin module
VQTLPIATVHRHNHNKAVRNGLNQAMAAQSSLTEAQVPEMLVGQALLERARALSNRPEDQIARACGYVGPSGRLLKKSFYRALVEAKGYTLPAGSGGGGSSGNGAKGRQAEFRTRVHGNGNLLIGHAYTRRMGLEPGQEFRIELHRDSRAIWLTPLDAGSEGDQTDDDQQDDL